MSFLEDEMSTCWELYYTGGTLRAARGLDMWINEVTGLAKSSQGGHHIFSGKTYAKESAKK